MYKSCIIRITPGTKYVYGNQADTIYTIIYQTHSELYSSNAYSQVATFDHLTYAVRKFLR